MKATLKVILILVVILSVYACSKQSNIDNTSLTGKWKLTETLQDPGDGSGKYTPVAKKADYDYVQFNGDGKLEGSFFLAYVTYKMKDSVDLAFYKSDSTIQYYRYKFHDGVLDLSPNGPVRCFEPCGSRFVKVSN